MNIFSDQQLISLLCGIFGLLFAVSLACFALKRGARYRAQQQLIDEIETRTRSWWIMALIFTGALASGRYGTIALFLIISLLALREYITILPTKRADHRALIWSLMLVVPLHYYLIAIEWYGLFSIFIPVYAFLMIPSRMVVSGDCENFLARAATIQWGLMLSTYLLSYAPALLTLQIPGYQGEGAKLLLYLVVLTEMSDIFQFAAGKSLGKRKIAPAVSPQKTWEGFLGGLAGTTFLSLLLAPVTPFSFGTSILFGWLIVVTGFFGGLTLSAIKRDHGIKDYGTLLAGHGGVLDRIDSLCFAAPLFFHVVRFFYTE